MNTENQKEKLIELLRLIASHPEKTCIDPDGDNCFDCKYFMDGGCDHYAREAGYLIENGVIVLPCKVGDTVYKVCPVNLNIKIRQLLDGKIVKKNCDRCAYKNCACFDIYRNATAITVIENVSEDYIIRWRNSFGKSLFLTREDAEKALAERNKENE